MNFEVDFSGVLFIGFLIVCLNGIVIVSALGAIPAHKHGAGFRVIVCSTLAAVLSVSLAILLSIALMAMKAALDDSRTLNAELVEKLGDKPGPVKDLRVE